MELLIPSKTFLIGEYSALIGGDALVLCTEPQFAVSLTARANDTVEHTPLRFSKDLHPQSPAGRLLSRYPELQQLAVRIADPWLGNGGFGASSAQFLAFEYARQTLGKNFVKTGALHASAGSATGRNFDLQIAVDQFRELYREESVPPSGYDILAQGLGGVVKIKNQIAECLSWPWPEYSFLIVPTGNKQFTHTHLQDLNKYNFSELLACAEAALQHFLKADVSTFSGALTRFRVILHKMGLECLATTELIEWMTKLSGVLAVKGCGALGTDSLVMIVESACTESICAQLRARGYGHILTQLSGGLKVTPKPSSHVLKRNTPADYDQGL